MSNKEKHQIKQIDYMEQQLNKQQNKTTKHKTLDRDFVKLYDDLMQMATIYTFFDLEINECIFICSNKLSKMIVVVKNTTNKLGEFVN